MRKEYPTPPAGTTKALNITYIYSLSMKLHLPKLLLSAVIAAGMSLGQAFADDWVDESNNGVAYYIMSEASAVSIDAHSTAANRIYQIKAAQNHTDQKEIETLILRNKSTNRFMRNWSGPTSLNANIGTLKFGSNGDGSGTLISDGGNDITIGQIAGTLVGLYNGGKLTIGRNASEGVDATTTTIGATLLNSGPVNNDAGMYTTGSAGIMTINGDIVIAGQTGAYEVNRTRSTGISYSDNVNGNGFITGVETAYYYLVKGANVSATATSATLAGSNGSVELVVDNTSGISFKGESIQETRYDTYFVNKGAVTYNDASEMNQAGQFLVADKASFVVDKGSDVIKLNTFTADNKITVEAGGNATAKTTGNVYQDGALTIASGTTLTVDGAATYKNNDQAINNGGTLVLNNVKEATLNGATKISSDVTLSGNTTLKFSNGDCINYDLRKALTWTVNEGAKLDFGGTRQAFTSGSKIILAGGSVIGEGDGYGAIDVVENGTLTIAAIDNSTLSATVRLRNNATFKFDVAQGKTLTVDALLKNRGDNENERGGFKKIGQGTMVVSGENTYSGTTTIEAGTLRTENEAALGTGAVSVTGGKLQVAKALTISSLTLSGEGALDLAGGTLTVNSSITLSTVTADFSKYFNADSLSATLVTVTGDNSTITGWGGAVTGTYSAADGTAYTTTIDQIGTSIVLSFEPDPVEQASLAVTEAVLGERVLTLTVAGDMTGLSSVDLLLTDSLLAAIDGKSGLVSLTLTDAKDAVYSTVGENAMSVTFGGGAYVGEKNEAGEATGMYRVEYIPEPTTATLSLLALCGLAARRRRK